MKELQPGDVVMVCKLDRFARSIRDLLDLLDQIEAAGTCFRSSGRDLSSLQGRLIMNIMGSLAEFEHELIRQRCSEGIKRAKAAGIYMGRPYKLNVKQRKLIARRREEGESLKQIATALNVSTAVAWRALQ
jgi:DNA invertase Pin-like site-specific DNA recombinase